MKTLIATLLILCATAAQAQIYKCTEGGKAVYSDRPCGEQQVTIKAAPKPEGPSDLDILRENYLESVRVVEETQNKALAEVQPQPDTPCDVDASRVAVASMDDVLSKFSRVEDVAGSTARIALAGPMLELNRIAETFRNIRAAEGCESILHRTAMYYIEATIDGYKSFSLGSSNENSSKRSRAFASRAYTQYLQSKAAFGF